MSDHAVAEESGDAGGPTASSETDVFRSRPRHLKQPISWFSRRPEKSNQFCLYCGRFVGAGAPQPTDKEHMIGRAFVPVGSLGGDAFNFHFRACRVCNAEKADAERHLSSVTLFDSPSRSSDEVAAEALRKASGDFHPDTGGPVKDAFVEQTVTINFGFGTATFNMVGPPQPSRRAVMLLATRQVQALFSLVTTEDPRDPARSRLLPAENAIVLGHYGHRDWANAHLLELERRTKHWPAYVQFVTAGGHFRAVVRASDHSAEGYFWAFEWNKSLRVVGAIGNPHHPAGWTRDLPPLPWQQMSGSGWRHRRETALADDDDTLFAFDEIEVLPG